jgi:hypothetical protein
LLKDFLKRHRDAEGIQLLDYLFGTRVAKRAQLAQALFERLELGEVQGKNVDFVIVLKCAQLDARDKPHAQTLGGRTRRGNAVDRVVVGQRNGGESTALCRINYLLGR